MLYLFLFFCSIKETLTITQSKNSNNSINTITICNKKNKFFTTSQLKNLIPVYECFLKTEYKIEYSKIISALERLNWIFCTSEDYKTVIYSLFFDKKKSSFKQENDQHLYPICHDLGNDVTIRVYDDHHSDIAGESSKKYNLVTIYSLFVFPEYRNLKFSRKSLEYINDNTDYDILSLAIDVNDEYFSINFLNYYKNGFRICKFSDKNPDNIFSETLEEFEKLKDPFDLNLKKFLGYRYLQLYCRKGDLFRKCDKSNTDILKYIREYEVLKKDYDSKLNY